jgi:hypothetical protein
MRLQLIIEFDGSPQELIALLPAQIGVQSFQRLTPNEHTLVPGLVKCSGARSHMDAATVAQIYAAFDAGQTIEQIGARKALYTRPQRF